MSDEADNSGRQRGLLPRVRAGDIRGDDQNVGDDNVSCVFPGWPALVGRQAILESIGKFGQPEQERIDPRNETVLISAARPASVR